jgi:anti-sigma regulatory factor (Ser/Thr protein kinase)
MPKDTLSLNLKNRLSELEVLRNGLEQFGKALGLSKRCVFELNLALEELFTNIISYGLTNSARHCIKIDIRRRGKELIVRIEDDGIPFNMVDSIGPDTRCSLEERDVGGLGVLLAKKVMDEIVYKRCGNANVLTMKKTILKKKQ